MNLFFSNALLLCSFFAIAFANVHIHVIVLQVCRPDLQLRDHELAEQMVEQGKVLHQVQI